MQRVVFSCARAGLGGGARAQAVRRVPAAATATPVSRPRCHRDFSSTSQSQKAKDAVRLANGHPTQATEDAVNKQWAPVYKVVTLGCCAVAGYHVLPFAFQSSVPHAVKLCQSKDSFMQKSGLARMKAMTTSEGCCKQMVESHDALSTLLSLMARTDDDMIVEDVVFIMHTLVTTIAQEEFALLMVTEGERIERSMHELKEALAEGDKPETLGQMVDATLEAIAARGSGPQQMSMVL